MPSRFLLLFAFVLALGAWLPAQCSLQMLPGDQVAGVHLGNRVALMRPYVEAMTEWDPDGAGPLGTHLVIGGEFGAVGGIAADNIAAFDPATGQCSSLGQGSLGEVPALVTLPTGELVASGYFPVAGGGTAPIARWNGTSWIAMANGITSSPFAMTVLPGGQIVAGGAFGVARWTGSTWVNLGAVNGIVRSLRVLANGDLLVGGQFTLAGGVPASNIALWDGLAWSALGSGLGQFSFSVGALAELPGGNLVAGCTVSGGAAVFAWDGLSWAPLGSGLSVGVDALAILPSGGLVAAGYFGAPAGGLGTHIALWDGLGWTHLSSGTDRSFRCLLSTPTRLLAGGEFTRVDGVGALGLAGWDGSVWSPVIQGTDGAALALAPTADADDEFFVGGNFLRIGGVVTNRIARRTGSGWQPLGSGLDNQVQALLTMPNGDLIVGGQFLNAGGIPASRIARWDGSSWWAMGSGFQSTSSSTSVSVAKLVLLPNGHVVAGGSFNRSGSTVVANIAVWDGFAWSPLGSGSPSRVRSVAVAGNGELLAIGGWLLAGASHGIARWNGSAWLPTGTSNGLERVEHLTTLASGAILATGPFTQIAGTTADGAAIWNGVAWAQAANGQAGITSNAAMLPNGEALVAGFFGPNVHTTYDAVARWDGTTFRSEFDSEPLGATALEVLRNGDIVLAGPFARAGSQVSASVLILSSTCPATVDSLASSCPNSAVLWAVTRPWIGGNYDFAATVPMHSVTFGMVGFGATLQPLASLTPLAPANCNLLVVPDATLFYQPIAGQVSGRIAIPASTAFAGLVLHQQLLQLQLNATGGIVAVEASNALTLTVGAL